MLPFSFGMIFTELLGAGIPYGDLDADTHEQVLIEAVKNQKYKDRLLRISPKFNVKELISSCWDEGYIDRPSFAVLLASLKSYQKDIGTLLLHASAQVI